MDQPNNFTRANKENFELSFKLSIASETHDIR